MAAHVFQQLKFSPFTAFRQTKAPHLSAIANLIQLQEKRYCLTVPLVLFYSVRRKALIHRILFSTPSKMNSRTKVPNERMHFNCKPWNHFNSNPESSQKQQTKRRHCHHFSIIQVLVLPLSTASKYETTQLQLHFQDKLRNNNFIFIESYRIERESGIWY